MKKSKITVLFALFAGVVSSERQEAENTGFDKNMKLRTRLMYFDLISLVGEWD